MNEGNRVITPPPAHIDYATSTPEVRLQEGSIVTFYSYKGGVGRTLALANIAVLLAQWGYRVLCVDWDLEAPGLHLYYKPWLEQPLHPGLTELIHAHAAGGKPAWEDYVTKVRLPEAKEPLLLMTAGAQDEGYVGRMQRLEWKQFYETHQLGNFLEELRNQWKSVFDFVLIDSRTGITDIGGICTIQLPDILVLFFTANDQSLHGAVDVAQRANRMRNHLPFDRARLVVLPVPTRFEGRFEYQIAQEWLQTFAQVLAPFYKEWIPQDVPVDLILNFTRVPYVPYWSFGERLPVLEEDTRDPDGLTFALEDLAALLAQKLAFSDVLVRNRETFVAAARRGPLRDSGLTSALHTVAQQKPVRIFVSYSHRDTALSAQFLMHLTVLRRQNLIEAWHDRQIGAGTDWSAEIDLNLEEADLVLLLISADFLASDYAYDVEVRRALERHAAGECQVIPILVRPADWSGTPFASLPMLPSDSRPVTLWANQDEAWVDVVKGIRQAIGTMSPTS